MTTVLVIVSGLPGVGNSVLTDALGRNLAAPVLSVDPIEAAIWRCGIEPSFETGGPVVRLSVDATPRLVQSVT